MAEKNSRLVYSTASGRVRESAPARRPPPGDGIARVRRETGGRRGKVVTTIRGLPLDEPALRRLAAELKAECGSGGTVKAFAIEIQGDHRERVLEALRRRGFRAVAAGG